MENIDADEFDESPNATRPAWEVERDLQATNPLYSELPFHEQARLLSRAMGGRIESREMSDGTYQHTAKAERMEWTTKYPTKPGYYWMRELAIDEGCIVRFLRSPEDPEKSDGKFYFTGREYACRDALPGTMWYGPLEPPA